MSTSIGLFSVRGIDLTAFVDGIETSGDIIKVTLKGPRTLGALLFGWFMNMEKVGLSFNNVCIESLLTNLSHQLPSPTTPYPIKTESGVMVKVYPEEQFRYKTEWRCVEEQSRGTMILEQSDS